MTIRERPDFMDMRAQLTLDRLGDDLYAGVSPKDRDWRVFGGQLIGQALRAACETVDGVADAPPNSLHAHFIRGGNPTVPIHYAVDRIRDSKAFHTRQVNASQNDKLVFTLTSTFHRPEEGFRHGDPMPAVTMPDDVKNWTVEEVEAKYGPMPEDMRENWDSGHWPHDARHVTERFMYAPRPADPDLQIWWKSTCEPALPPAAEDPISHLVNLAYCTDMMFMDACLMPHGKSLASPDMLSVSIDHAVWFHQPVDMHQWHLFSAHSSWADNGRGHVDGKVWREDGLHVATVAQECLLRPATPDQGF